MKMILPLLKLNVPTKNSRIYSNMFVSHMTNGSKVYGEIDNGNTSSKIDNSDAFGMALLVHDKDTDIINANIQFYDTPEAAKIFDSLTTGKFVLRPKISVKEENIEMDGELKMIKKFSIISFSIIPKHLSSQSHD